MYLRARNDLRALFALLAVWLLCGGLATAEMLEVRVVGPDRQPVPDVAVFVEQVGVPARASSLQKATMDQRDSNFVPHILVVRKGADVDFPNSDAIAHHVYSFSKPNDFVLPLYKGVSPEPVRFEYDGIVTVGCNIHDGMLGYIVVVNTEVYGMTGVEGTVVLNVDEGASEYKVRVWSPRIRDSRTPLEITISAGDSLTAVFALKKNLRAAHTHHTESVSWDGYD